MGVVKINGCKVKCKSKDLYNINWQISRNELKRPTFRLD